MSDSCDHYIEIPVDLSEVLFIATANNVQGIPRPLLDRMELIEISSYTENEKLHIAKEHLLKKQIRKHGLENYTFTVSGRCSEKMITSYTREAGVRDWRSHHADLQESGKRDPRREKRQSASQRTT